MGLELPEVLNISKQMDHTVRGKTIKNVLLGDRCSGIIKLGMCNLDRRKDEIVNSTVSSIEARGKWIFLEFNNGKFLLLGELIGKLLYHKDESEIPEVYHVLFEFDDNTSLSFQSSLYGFLEIDDPEQLEEHKYAGNIGISPDDKKFTYSYFKNVLLRNEKKPVKALLGLQTDISGLGNVYINDILYEAKLHPKRKAVELEESEQNKLYETVVEITKSAIELKGSTQEVDLFGKPGRYIRIMDKDSTGEGCKRCGTRIVKMNILGSSSYFCPGCQKI
ncbi:MAG: hypothetical protein JSV22_02205 [Bacteroidales bacterium]|nr:MAG: hypothetical protein JSV22_02205 [Bacteroidales bacterium]